MSRQTVRQHIADWLAPPAVPYLNSVFPYARAITPASATLGVDNLGSGAVMWVWLRQQHQTPLAMPLGSLVAVTYDCTLQLYFRSVKGAAEDGQEDFDTLVEGLLERLRSDPRLGSQNSAGPIFQAGLGEMTGTPLGQRDLTVSSDLPQTVKSGGSEIWAALEMTVCEEVQFTPVLNVG